MVCRDLCRKKSSDRLCYGFFVRFACAGFCAGGPDQKNVFRRDVSLSNIIGCKRKTAWIACIYDYLRFTKLLCERQIVSPSTFDMMTEWNEFDDDDEDVTKVGLAITHWQNATKDIWGMGHSGSTQGTGGFVYYFPDTGITIALFTNNDTERGIGREVFIELWEEIVKVVVGK